MKSEEKFEEAKKSLIGTVKSIRTRLQGAFEQTSLNKDTDSRLGAHSHTELEEPGSNSSLNRYDKTDNYGDTNLNRFATNQNESDSRLGAHSHTELEEQGSNSSLNRYDKTDHYGDTNLKRFAIDQYESDSRLGAHSQTNRPSHLNPKNFNGDDDETLHSSVESEASGSNSRLGTASVASDNSYSGLNNSVKFDPDAFGIIITNAVKIEEQLNRLSASDINPALVANIERNISNMIVKVNNVSQDAEKSSFYESRAEKLNNGLIDLLEQVKSILLEKNNFDGNSPSKS